MNSNDKCCNALDLRAATCKRCPDLKDHISSITKELEVVFDVLEDKKKEKKDKTKR